MSDVPEKTDDVLAKDIPVSDAAPADLMDIYVRMNTDNEKDYCFQADRNQPVSSLISIFKTLPMILSPSYFYNPMPIGFSVSVHPGFLTSEGALLFDVSSHEDKYCKNVDQSALLKDIAYEGQLIVPVWEWNQQRFLTVMSILMAWLYLDLPDVISPTPGMQPTVLAANLIGKIFPSFAKANSGDENPFSGLGWQWGFFAFHVLKVSIIFLFLYIGGANPASFNPIKGKKFMAERKLVNRDQLLSIGWTGVRRATPSEWKEENRKTKIEAAGGIVKAYHAGILTPLATAGVELGPGEGWDSANKKALDDKPGRFIVDAEYFDELYKYAVTECNGLDEEAAVAYLKAFRRGGPPDCSDVIKARYEARKALEEEEKGDKNKK